MAASRELLGYDAIMLEFALEVLGGAIVVPRQRRGGRRSSGPVHASANLAHHKLEYAIHPLVDRDSLRQRHFWMFGRLVL